MSLMQAATGNIPQLCFGRVGHTRLRPVRNRFSYGVYFLRLPLRSLSDWSGAAPLLSRNRFNLLSFHDSDHGDGQLPLTEWIDTLLTAEGITDADGEIWLQTFPRVLGYVFNPVSFWFCHRKDGSLRAVLCVVTNTFGERHCYLLDTGAPMAYGIELSARKVFHVSPFCAIEGDYRFRFTREVRPDGATLHGRSQDRTHKRTHEHTLARIDHHDVSGPLLLTGISGVSADVTTRAVLRAFLFYPLMTFGVVAKIHWQALRLWFKRVPFFRKPTPPSSRLSR